MRRTLPAIMLLAGLLAAGATAAKVYKWVDDEGVTHYSQQPPPGGEAQVIDPEVSRPPEGSADEASASGSEASGATSDDAEGETQSLADFCQQLRDQAQLLASDRPVKIKQSEDTLVTLEGERRQRRLEDVKSQIQQHCQDQGS